MAAGYLLDTNVVLETRRVRADAGVMAFVAAANPALLFLSVLTLGELRRGVQAKRRSDAAAADGLGVWVDGIETLFSERVLTVDAAVARRWGELSAGRTLPVTDTLGQQERPSFLKKRSKKLLDIGTRASQRPKPNEQKFFGSFFQKRTACFLRKSQPQRRLV